MLHIFLYVVSEVHKKKSISPILGLGRSLLHVWLFLERGRARKMWQLSINHRDVRIPRASLACRFAEKRGGKNREIKIRVYGKRERQTVPRDHDFPTIFHVCRLPSAVFNAKRTVFTFVNNVSIYRKFFKRSTTFTGLCLGLMLFYFIFYAK